jgi:hypothetical protein
MWFTVCMVETKKIDKEQSKVPTEKPLDNSLVHDFNMKNTSIFTQKLLIILIIAVVLGLGSGYGLSKRAAVGVDTTGGTASSSKVEKGTIVGSGDTKIFKDVAEGILKMGGIDGEGAYHLVRPGGDSQKVYLTSSHVDLSKFISRKIKVWGETQAAKVAGWLMDVGKLEVLQ